jgi:hypothetical protein
MSISRGWTWINDEVAPSEEQVDHITPTLNAYASRWSALKTQIENEQFTRQSEREEGHSYDPECDECGGRPYLRLMDASYYWDEEEHGYTPIVTIGERMLCIACKGSGFDVKEMDARKQRARQREADRDVEVEIIEAKLAHYGARIMGEYEHWNEDAPLVAYMERER